MKKKIKEKLEKLFEENTAGYDYVLAVEINKLLKEERNKTIDEILGVLNGLDKNYGDGTTIESYIRLSQAIESIKLLREK
jgi:phage terminase small subunit